MSVGCYYCGTTTEELRPYGPGGSPLCFPCMKETPDRERAAKEAFAALLGASLEIGGGIATIGGEDGPRPGFNP